MNVSELEDKYRDFDFSFDMTELLNPPVSGLTDLTYFKFSRYVRSRLAPLYVYLRNESRRLNRECEEIENKLSKLHHDSFERAEVQRSLRHILHTQAVFDPVLTKVRLVLIQRHPEPMKSHDFFTRMNDYCSGILRELNYIRNVLINNGSIDW